MSRASGEKEVRGRSTHAPQNARNRMLTHGPHARSLHPRLSQKVGGCSHFCLLPLLQIREGTGNWKGTARLKTGYKLLGRFWQALKSKSLPYPSSIPRHASPDTSLVSRRRQARGVGKVVGCRIVVYPCFLNSSRENGNFP